MGKDTLVVLWSGADKETAKKMVFMYSKNAKIRGWWKDVILVIWGPSAQLVAGDGEIRDSIKELAQAGIVLEACKACSDMYGVSGDLEELGVDVKYIGEQFTAYLKEEYTVIAL